jgi:AraC family transcriptional regulator
LINYFGRKYKKYVNLYKYELQAMKPRIVTFPEKRLIGKRLRMTLTDNRTVELWKSFMPKRKLILNSKSADLFSIRVYEKIPDFINYTYDTEFEKWAAVEVENFDNVPDEMETFTLPGGLYAVFDYKGAASAGEKIFRYIFETWLPDSAYFLDNRPHFEILGEKYKNEDPESEEEVCIPIKLKD